MNSQLVVIGVVCIVAALVGGGLKLVGDFPPITNPFVQVLVGLVGLGSVLLGLYGNKISGTAAPATTTVTPGGATTRAAPPTSVPEAPLWQGTILLGERGINFSEDPPRLGTINDISVNVSAYASSHTITGSVFTGSRIARWTGNAAPTATDCANLLSTHGIGETKFDRHDTFCLGAGEGSRIVILTFQNQQGDRWEISATVWHAPS